MAESETYRRGREIRRQLLGDEYVQQAERTTYDDPRMRKFIDLATETVFGSLWARPGLDLKTRTLVCVVSDAATGRDAELGIHLRMALRALREDGRIDAGGRLRPAPAVRGVFPGRGWLPGRARPRLALGAPDPDPPRLPPVHQSASGAPAQGGHVAARRKRTCRHRHADRAREQRGRVLRDRRAALHGDARGAGRPAGDLHPPGRWPRHALPPRAGPPAAPPPPD